ncbi:unnamed protein product [Angiostrongylus costaricensis]|uniref:MARVEL domain-containing protein n=1 Tax=Angiostrongylus costaricensis TaxID=334426 RepID=A0A0R3PYP6_ANGCS|nr:unnamed protein product [Angiostrongylus costaricensis]
MPVFINFAFLALAVFSLTSYAFSWRKRNSLLVLPILIYETVTIFWTMVWLYASITAVATGYLWSLEWIGGPRSNRAAVSYDANDIRYVDPNESSPETRNAIKYGSIIIMVSLVVFVLKGLAWSIARRVFRELRKENTKAMEDDNGIAVLFHFERRLIYRVQKTLLKMFYSIFLAIQNSTHG